MLSHGKYEDLYNEVPDDVRCPCCLSPLKLEYATRTPSFEFWLYKCSSGICDLKFSRLVKLTDDVVK